MTQFLFVINHKIINFFGTYFIPQFQTHIMFLFVVRKPIFQIIVKLPLDTQTSITISKQTDVIFIGGFQELFHYRIHSKHHIFHLYRLGFQKHLQFLHIQTGHYLILFF